MGDSEKKSAATQSGETPRRPALAKCDPRVAGAVALGVISLLAAVVMLGLSAIASVAPLGTHIVLPVDALHWMSAGLGISGLWWLTRWNRALASGDALRTLGKWVRGLGVGALVFWLPAASGGDGGFLYALPLWSVGLWVSSILAVAGVLYYLSFILRAMDVPDLAGVTRGLRWVSAGLMAAPPLVGLVSQSPLIAGRPVFPMGAPLPQLGLAAIWGTLLVRVVPRIIEAARAARGASVDIKAGHRDPLMLQIAACGAWMLLVSSAIDAGFYLLSLMPTFDVANWSPSRMALRQSVGMLPMIAGGIAVIAILVLLLWQSRFERPIPRDPLALLLWLAQWLIIAMDLLPLPSDGGASAGWLYDGLLRYRLAVNPFVVTVIGLLVIVCVWRMALKVKDRWLAVVSPVALVAAIITNTLTMGAGYLWPNPMPAFVHWTWLGVSPVAVVAGLWLWFRTARTLERLADEAATPPSAAPGADLPPSTLSPAPR